MMKFILNPELNIFTASVADISCPETNGAKLLIGDMRIIVASPDMQKINIRTLLYPVNKRRLVGLNMWWQWRPRKILYCL